MIVPFSSGKRVATWCIIKFPSCRLRGGRPRGDQSHFFSLSSAARPFSFHGDLVVVPVRLVFREETVFPDLKNLVFEVLLCIDVSEYFLANRTSVFLRDRESIFLPSFGPIDFFLSGYELL